MTKGKNQHVVKHLDGSAVKGADNSKATKVTRIQVQAIDVAENIARTIRNRPSLKITVRTDCSPTGIQFRIFM